MPARSRVQAHVPAQCTGKWAAETQSGGSMREGSEGQDDTAACPCPTPSTYTHGGRQRQRMMPCAPPMLRR
ncbi:hypothetical protein PLICRDRAFT_58019 [Plicaturopsis crispa FD-325 SS-3]|uniref:Uncharacterized protein n=1 Tax=Plicaturopsis crispa FD-325 SS-3 TaxID=944288 RepID=A0A0C9SR12_PLICR|nr:hypothetical protein PLICRDRAFT_58019 [Plicaturopsis crispa FD-325 SS-3]